MKLNFNINFHTIWGQTLFITGSIPELGNWDPNLAFPLKYTQDGNWTLEIDIPDQPVSFEYHYFMKSNGKLIFEEWEKNHRLTIENTEVNLILFDYWQNRPRNLAYYSSAFTKSIFAHHPESQAIQQNVEKKITIKVLAPHLKSNQSLIITGNQDFLGNWNPGKALPLHCIHFPEWFVEVEATQLSYPVEYKFCVIDRDTKALEYWECGENRTLNIPSLKDHQAAVVSGLIFREEVSDWKCAGFAIPIFSLRSEESYGIGDFADLKKIMDWTKITCQKVIQILPINDTTMTHSWMDSYPYNAISIFALHPVYMHLKNMGTLSDPERQAYYDRKQIELNASDVIDYETVSRIKWEFFREIYAETGTQVLESPGFSDFFRENQDWLIPYSAYSYLRDKNNTPDFRKWPEYARYTKDRITKLCSKKSPDYPEIAIYFYLQYHLHKQLSAARDYAYSQGIILKGDIPIGISSTSIEAWTEPECFNMNVQVGAPPDDFSLSGQNWGFPSYNWNQMESDQFSWWKKRFQKMSDYFDAYRIDHILGFFRVWEIPNHSVQGLLGCFNPSLPYTRQEIQDAGMHFDEKRLTTPHINESFLHELFGEFTSEVKDVFLERTSSRHFALKKRFDTQRKIQSYFLDKEDSKNTTIREGLYAIANEVLFIPDQERHGYFHPRIASGSTYLYQELTRADKYAFDYLYWNFFYQRHNEFWKEQAIKRLTPLISCTDMLVCGEDLGMIPQSVPEVMHRLQILSLEIERMPKEINVEFTNLKRLPYHSVCTTSTHDMNPLRAWWKEDPEKTQRYFNQVLLQGGDAPKDCSPEICEQILMNHLDSSSLLCILPFQDWLSISEKWRRKNEEEERINIPANPRHYWQYRMHLTIEELLQAHDLNASIGQLIRASKRFD